MADTISVGPYYRTLANGRRVRVKRHRRPDTGKRGKTPRSKRVLPELQPGKLPGYHPSQQTLGQRRWALNKLVRGKSAAKVLQVARRLQVLANYTSNSQPRNAAKYRSDAKYMFNKYHAMK